MDTTTAPLASIGIDIGKEVFLRNAAGPYIRVASGSDLKRRTFPVYPPEADVAATTTQVSFGP
jgi:hypothetical protein